jgi:hypothetical protein
MKTNWEKEFDKKFNCDSPNGKAIVLIYENTQEPAQNIIKQFISDLRKTDMEELIEMLPEMISMGDDGIIIGQRYYKDKVKQLIKNYYNLIK